jgi:tetratricopeptide (TPR) repeat protein
MRKIGKCLDKVLSLGLVSWVCLGMLSCQTTGERISNPWQYSAEKTESEVWRDFQMAVEKNDLDSANQLFPKFKVFGNSNQYYYLGRYYFLKGDLERALGNLEKSFQLAPNKETGLYLAESYVAIGKIKNAESLLVSLQEKFPNDKQIRYALGLLWKGQERFLEAETLFKDLISASSQQELSIYARHYLDILLILKKKDLAQNWLENIGRQLDPRSKNDLFQIWELNHLLEQGYIAQKSGNFPKALENFQKALILQPNNGEIAYIVTEILCKNKRFGEAEEKIAKMNMGEWKYLSIGTYFYYLGDKEKALQFWKQGFRDFPNNFENCLRLAVLYFELGNLSLSKYYIQEGKNLEPRSSLFPFLLGNIYLLEDSYLFAIQEFRLAQDLGHGRESVIAQEIARSFQILSNDTENSITDEEINYTLNKIQNSPYQNIFRNNIAYFYFQKKDYEKSRTIYESILSISPENTSALIGLLKISNILNDQSGFRFYKSQLDSLSERDAKLKEYYSGIYTAMGVIDSKKETTNFVLPLKFWTMSPKDLVLFHKENPNFAGLFPLIHALESYNQKDKILQFLDLLAKENPLEYREVQAVYLLKYGDKSNAEKTFSKIQASEKNNYFIEYQLGILHQNNDLQKSNKHFLTALALNPRFPPTRVGLGRNFYKSKDYVKAKKYFEDCKADFPDFDLSYYNLGMLYLESGNFDLAQKEFKTLVKKFPESSEGYYGLYLVYQKQNRIKESLKFYSQYKKRVGQSIQRSSNSPKKELLETGIEKKGEYFRTPIFSGQEIFVFYSGSIYKYNLNDSQMIWRKSFEEIYKNAYLHPLGILIEFSDHRFLFVDRWDGEILWELRIIAEEIEQVRVANAIYISVILPRGQKKLYELNLYGNIIRDRVLDSKDNWEVDELGRIYLWKGESNGFKFSTLNEHWKQKEIGSLVKSKLRFFARGKTGIYFVDNNILYYLEHGFDFQKYPIPSKEIQRIQEIDDDLFLIYKTETLLWSESKWIPFSKKSNVLQIKKWNTGYRICTEKECEYTDEMGVTKKIFPLILNKQSIYRLE